jgi:tetratricopeptide (TPR) repeat protein
MRLVLLAGLALLAGCAQPPKATSTARLEAARQEAALEANRRGDTYVRRGELDNAARAYREALRLSQSLEDAEGIAANAINLSIVLQRQGRFADARSTLHAVTENSNLRFTPARLAEVSLRQALIDLDERRLVPAEEWVAKAAAHCAERCALAGAIHNVRAQLALQSGNNDQAAAHARAAQAASRGPADRAELANALRLLGFTALRAGDAAAARTQLEQALALDREIGAPRKIVLDLLALGRAAALGGDRDGARAYYARAMVVSEADRDNAGVAEARALMDSVDKAAAIGK